MLYSPINEKGNYITEAGSMLSNSEFTETRYNVTKPNIDDIKFLVVKNNVNALIRLNEFGWARYRAEMIVCKDDKFFCYLKDNEAKFPGGSLDKGETPFQAAARETLEEARLRTKDISYYGNYIQVRNEPKQWVLDKIPSQYQWKTYYTELFVATYDGQFKGKINSEDEDKDMVKYGKWYRCSDLKQYCNNLQYEAMKQMIEGKQFKSAIHNYELYKYISK